MVYRSDVFFQSFKSFYFTSRFTVEPIFPDPLPFSVLEGPKGDRQLSITQDRHPRPGSLHRGLHPVRVLPKSPFVNGSTTSFGVFFPQNYLTTDSHPSLLVPWFGPRTRRVLTCDPLLFFGHLLCDSDPYPSRDTFRPEVDREAPRPSPRVVPRVRRSGRLRRQRLVPVTLFPWANSLTKDQGRSGPSVVGGTECRVHGESRKLRFGRLWSWTV